MVESIVPGNSITVNVKKSFSVDVDQTYKDIYNYDIVYNHIAVIMLDSNRDDTRFYIPAENNSIILTAVNPYGLIIVPYNNPDIDNKVNFKVVAGGKTYHLDSTAIPITSLLTGDTYTLVDDEYETVEPA